MTDTKSAAAKATYRILQLAVVLPLGVAASFFGITGLILSFTESDGAAVAFVGIIVSVSAGFIPAFLCRKAYLRLGRLIAGNIDTATTKEAMPASSTESGTSDSPLTMRSNTQFSTGQPNVTHSVPLEIRPDISDKLKLNARNLLIISGCFVPPFLGFVTEDKHLGQIFGALCLAFAVAALFTWQWSKVSKKRYLEYKQETLANCANNFLYTTSSFTPAQQFISSQGTFFIAADEQHQTVMIGGCTASLSEYASRLITVYDIIGLDILEDDRPTMNTEAGNALAGAALGGFIFGGAGAIVGAIAASKSRIISRVALVLKIDSLSTPLVAINFLEEPNQKESVAHKAALEQARRWHGIISVLLHRNKRLSTTSEEQTGAHG